jgi:hypothetical protein
LGTVTRWIGRKWPSGRLFGGALKAGTVPNRNGAVTSAVLVHLRVEPAHFDWRWRERPVLALLAWEAMARDPLARLRRIQAESIGTTTNLGPAAITNRDIAASPLLIAFSAKTNRIELAPFNLPIIADGLPVDQVRTGDHGPKL